MSKVFYLACLIWLIGFVFGIKEVDDVTIFITSIAILNGIIFGIFSLGVYDKKHKDDGLFSMCLVFSIAFLLIGFAFFCLTHIHIL
jgi:hypothetical protein